MSLISETDLVLNPDGSVYHLNLLPEHIADNIIAVGDPDRVAMVTKHFEQIEFEMNKREFITQVGTYKGKRITVMSTGIGTDNVEIFFNELDALVNIDLQKREAKPTHKKLNIIRIGTSGALQDDIPLGSHLISAYGTGMDNLMSFYKLSSNDFEKEISKAVANNCGLDFMPYTVEGSAALLQLIGSDMLQGNTLTCPGFYAPQGRVLRAENKYPNLLAELNAFRLNDFKFTNFEMETSAYYAFGKLLGHEVISTNAIIANRMKRQFSDNPHKVVEALILKVLNNL
jgi:uridine phosphorylase